MSDFITLSSGKKVESNEDFIAISSNGKIASGYDDEIYVFSNHTEAISFLDDSGAGEYFYWTKDEIKEKTWTPAERKELAELMIERWKRFGGIE